jgi:glycosyltransferase involved in cell wall biosynthesis
MNSKSNIKVSLVIPAYNEENHLRSCLEAINNQTIAVYEVIVVDNNSTDDTRKIASSFKFVKLVNEIKQGVVYARNTGFNLAKGNIIARIDADTILPSDWIFTLTKIFNANDIDALSGAVNYYDIVFEKFWRKADLLIRKNLSYLLRKKIFLYGANMAIKKSAWQNVRSTICTKAGLHEDFDLAIHLQKLGHKVVFDPELSANVSLRRYDSSFLSFSHYIFMMTNTYKKHHITERIYLYPIILLILLTYWPLKLMHQGFDIKTHQFKLSNIWLARSSNRVDPTLNNI